MDQTFFSTQTNVATIHKFRTFLSFIFVQRAFILFATFKTLKGIKQAYAKKIQCQCFPGALSLSIQQFNKQRALSRIILRGQNLTFSMTKNGPSSFLFGLSIPQDVGVSFSMNINCATKLSGEVELRASPGKL